MPGRPLGRKELCSEDRGRGPDPCALYSWHPAPPSSSRLSPASGRARSAVTSIESTFPVPAPRLSLNAAAGRAE